MNLCFESLWIPTTQNLRTIRIRLPKSYNQSNKFYPVLYMHDGQNLFEDATSYSGHSWGIHETLQQLNLDDIIVVGIDNSEKRLFEYSPWKSSKEVQRISPDELGGLGDIYAHWLINSLKPMIDQNYRTLQDEKHTFIAGSSMGAYISIYIAVKYPNIFSAVGVFSLASWFNETDFLSFLRASTIHTNQRYFIAIGRKETSDDPQNTFNQLYLKNSIHFKNILEEKQVKDIMYIETDDTHNELAWRKVFPSFIQFIYK